MWEIGSQPFVLYSTGSTILVKAKSCTWVIQDDQRNCAMNNEKDWENYCRAFDQNGPQLSFKIIAIIHDGKKCDMFQISETRDTDGLCGFSIRL